MLLHEEEEARQEEEVLLNFQRKVIAEQGKERLKGKAAFRLFKGRSVGG